MSLADFHAIVSIKVVSYLGAGLPIGVQRVETTAAPGQAGVPFVCGPNVKWTQ